MLVGGARQTGLRRGISKWEVAPRLVGRVQHPPMPTHALSVTVKAKERRCELRKGCCAAKPTAAVSDHNEGTTFNLMDSRPPRANHHHRRGESPSNSATAVSLKFGHRNLPQYQPKHSAPLRRHGRCFIAGPSASNARQRGVSVSGPSTPAAPTPTNTVKRRRTPRSIPVRPAKPAFLPQPAPARSDAHTNPSWLRTCVRLPKADTHAFGTQCSLQQSV